jgi:lysophospholipase L1-like esterase
MARILAFGSSTSYGLYDHEHGGWVNRLKTTYIERNELHSQEFVPVYNFSAAGDLINKTIRRMETEVGTFISSRPTTNIAIFALGSLDSAISRATGETKTPIEEFSRLLPYIGELCISKPAEYFKEPFKPVFVGMAPVSEEYQDQTVNEQYANDSRSLFDSEVQAYALREGHMYIDIMNHFRLAHHISENGAFARDGFHPNAFGHSIIHNIVLSAVDTMLYGQSQNAAIA